MTISRESRPRTLVAASVTFFLALLNPVASLAVEANDVGFDDSGTTHVQGADVQAALESADAKLDDLDGHHTGVDAAADIVLLRKVCAGEANCFATMPALLDWITGVRTSTEPLLVAMGPGVFASIDCGSSWPSFTDVTFRGAGRDRTTIGDGTGLFGVLAVNCGSLEFQDLKVEGSPYSVWWQGAGRSVWTNTDLVGIWYDLLCGVPPIERSVHFFFGNQIEGDGSSAFISLCGENWIYGSDIVSRPTSVGAGAPTPLVVGGKGDVRVFGSTIRMLTDEIPDGTQTSLNYIGVLVGKGDVLGGPPGTGTFHMHGGIISVNASNLVEAGATGIHVIPGGNALVHTPGAAFTVLPGQNGQRTRISGNAQSPFQWPAGSTPPDLVSENGSDLFVETDCFSDGACDETPAGGESHLMIYDESCGSDPWRNVNTNACRNVAVP